MKKKTAPTRIKLKDSLEENKGLGDVFVERGYGGLLFVGQFCLSNKDALRLAKFIVDVVPYEVSK